MTAESYEEIGYERSEDGIATITLKAPQRLNAFTVRMGEELGHAIERAGSDHDVRAVVVTGEGRAFCAGMDLSGTGNVFGVSEEIRPTIYDMHRRLGDPSIEGGVRDRGGMLTLKIFNCPKPVIAAVNGPAVGIGATMTLAMDSRIASTSARFGFVFGRLGIVPEACSTWFLPKLVGIERALELAYAADILNADEAKEFGLVRSVHEAEDLLPAAYALARRFTHNRSQVGLALTRHMMWRNSGLPHPLDAHRVDSLAMWHTSCQDGKEGVAAFLEKRDPVFTSRVPEDLPNIFP